MKKVFYLKLVFISEYVDDGISIIDKIDSFKNPESSSSMLVNFKNLINDEYARDISRKIKSVYRIKQKKGEYIAAHVSFEYRKDLDNKYHLNVSSRKRQNNV